MKSTTSPIQMRFATSLLNSKAKHTLRALMLIMEGYHGAIPTPPTGNGTLAMPPIQSGQVESLVNAALNFRKCIILMALSILF